MLVFSILVISVVIPLYMLYWVSNGRTKNKSQMVIKTLGSGLVILALYLFNNWAFVGYYLRYLLPVLFVVAVIYGWMRVWNQPWRSRLDIGQWGTVFGGIFLMTISGLLLVNIMGSRIVPDHPVELEFPFQQGIFFMAQAGSSPALNGHMAVQSEPELRGQTWALDILQLNRFGYRASGIYPEDPQQYVIFNTSVYAPCNGVVRSIENNLPDLHPPERDQENLAGNYLEIECEHGFIVVLAHLKQESILVETGESVSINTRLGLTGNSGNTSEPHLHIHAQAKSESKGLLDADPLPILFRNHGWLVRNDIVRLP